MEKPAPTTGAPLSVSFIVPLYNQLALTREMLASLLATVPAELAFEVLFVDDCSSDGTRDWLASQKDPRISSLLNAKNRGYAANNNLGAAHARGSVLALLNNDLVLRPGWLAPMLAALEDPSVGIVGNLQERAADGALDHAGITLSARAKFEHIRELPEAPPSHMPVLAVTGACCLIRREVFLSAGGFDEAFLNGSEDVDLCLRLRQRGLSCLVATQSRIIHHVSASRGAISTRDEANSRRLLSRWHDTLIAPIAAAQGGPHAELLARSALWREEARWRELLDGAAPSDVRALAHSGFSHLSLLESPSVPERASVTLPKGTPRASLLVRCTRRVGLVGRLFPDAAIGLRVSINGIQTAEWPALTPGRHSLSIDAPASLPDRPTVVTLEPLVSVPSGGLASRLFRPLLARLLRIRRLTADDRLALELTRFAPRQT